MAQALLEMTTENIYKCPRGEKLLTLQKVLGNLCITAKYSREYKVALVPQQTLGVLAGRFTQK